MLFLILRVASVAQTGSVGRPQTPCLKWLVAEYAATELSFYRGAAPSWSCVTLSIQIVLFHSEPFHV